MTVNNFVTVEEIRQRYREKGYICSKEIAAILYMAYHLEKPILVEGPVGVGKTELAKTTSVILDIPLIRLQCYEGLDESKALYEWKYGKQLLYTQLLKDQINKIIGEEDTLEDAIGKLHQYEDIFFSPRFLEPRPLLKALQAEGGSVLLVDEVDKADQEFEAYLLEILSDFQVSIPEIGTIKAQKKPLVFLTSNNTREISDALRRRCLHLFIPYPHPDLEREIVQINVPKIGEELKNQLVSFVSHVRNLDIKKAPSISETIDWARALLLLNTEVLDHDSIKDTLNILLKFEGDIKAVQQRIGDLTALVKTRAGG